MIELLRRVAVEHPDHPAIVTDERTHTYGEVTARAEALAAGLLGRGITRVALVSEDAASVTSLLAAGALAGVEVCQYAPTSDADAVAELAGRFDHDIVLTDASLEEVATDAAGGSAPADVPTGRPLLILTTGSTGAPKGVRHDWDRVLKAASRVHPAPDERWLLAYGLHQFAGLQIVMHVVAAGATLIAPTHRRPQDGVAAMRTHDVRQVSATPTWWRFYLAQLRADGGAAPDLEQITLGGEAAPGPLLEELATTFPKARISHVYAASEFGSTGSVRDGQGGLDASALERGDDADVAMKVVDGELWVRSRVGMLGYYGEDPVDPDAWRPSGDLVEVIDGRIHFRGRTTEVINVGGVKVHPLPIEELVSKVPGVEVARVYGRANSVTGSIVAVEAIAAPDTDGAALKDAIRAACAHLPSASQPRSIKLVDELTTLGGKVIRRQT